MNKYFQVFINKTMSLKTGILVLFALLILSCKTNPIQSKKKTDNAIARVGNDYLYKDQLMGLGLEDMTVEDSAKVAQTFVNNWIKKRALVNNASKQISSEELLEVNEKVLDYRESLLSFLYESSVVSKKLDTTVTTETIQEYYNTHKKEFLVKKPIVKFLAVKGDHQFKNIDEISDWIEDFKEDGNDEEILEFCSYQTLSCQFNINNWVYLSDFYSIFGLDENNNKSKIKLTKNRLKKYKDDKYNYLYEIFDYRGKHQYYPIDFVETQIKSKILRKREQLFLDNLRESIYKTALDNNEIEIYNE